MKANNGSGNNEERDEWQTPQWLFDNLNNQYEFKSDCCASKENTKCKHYYTKEKPFEDFSQDIVDMAWMNPPFSKASEMFEHFFKVIKQGVAIYRCDNMETRIWQEVIFPNASWVFIPNKRIAYEGMNGNGSRFPSALIGFGLEPPNTNDGKTLFIDKENGGFTL